MELKSKNFVGERYLNVKGVTQLCLFENRELYLINDFERNGNNIKKISTRFDLFPFLYADTVSADTS